MIRLGGIAALLSCLVFAGGTQGKERTLSDAEIENLVRRSYQYVAMYNVNNKGAMRYGGWNIYDVDTKLKNYTLKVIARPNNDSLYITCMLDLRKESVILDMPAFESKLYVVGIIWTTGMRA